MPDRSPIRTTFMKQAIHPLPLLAALLGVSLAAPQAQGQVPTADHELHGADLAIRTPNLPAKALAVARLSGQFDPDAVLLLSDGSLHLGYQLARFQNLVQIATGRVAMAVYRTPTLSKDWVLTTGPGGLLRHQYSATAGPSATVVDPGWSEVTSLAVDSTGVLFGHHANSNKVYRRELNTGNELAALDVPAGVLQIELLDWDNDGNEDLAVRTASELHVYTGPDFELGWSDAAAGIHDRIAVVRGHSIVHPDVLVRTRFIPALGGTFVQSLRAGNLDDGWLPMGAPINYGLASGDVVRASGPGINAGPDGMNDLVALDRSDPQAIRTVLLQRATVVGNAMGWDLCPETLLPGQAFMTFKNLNDYEVVPEVLATGDLDLDGDMDLLCHGQLGANAEDTGYFLAWQLDRRTNRGQTIPITEWTVNGNSALMEWTGQFPSGATHLQVIVMVHDGIQNLQLLPNPIPQNGQPSVFVPAAQFGGVTLNLTTSVQNPVYNVILRSVELGGSGGQTVLRAWPSITLVVKPNPQQSMADFPEVAEALAEWPPVGPNGATTHSGGSQSSTGRPGQQPPPIVP